MRFLKRPKRLLLIFTAVFVCLFLMPVFSLAAGTQDSDVAENIFFYAYDSNNKLVLLKVVPLDTLKEMAHGSDGTNSTYYGTFIDKYPTPTYLEGRGVTIPELLEYVLENTSVENADLLTYSGTDKLYFISCDAASIYFTYDELLGVDRYYFPDLYANWHAYDNDDPDTYVMNIETVLAGGILTPPYLATESKGGRVFASAGGDNISSYVAANGGAVIGCMTGYLNDNDADEDALRLIYPQKQSDITPNPLTSNESTYSDIKKWVYKISLREASASPITALGTISNPTCTYTLNGTTLTITMECDDPDASIYYSGIGGYTTTPVNLYTGPITVEDYDTNDPFTLGLMAVREGYVGSSVVTASSADYVDGDEEPAFTYALSASDDTPQVGTAFTLDATLTSDKDYTLYGAEYRLVVPAAFTVDSVSAADGWDYGTATADGDTVVTFTYLDTAGSAVSANSEVSVGTLTLTPVTAGDAIVSVSEAIVTKSDATAYTNVTAAGLSLTVSSTGTVLLGDVNGDGSITIVDALYTCRAVNKSISLTDTQKLAADVNQDGSVTIVDALYICRYVNKSITSF